MVVVVAGLLWQQECGKRHTAVYGALHGVFEDICDSPTLLEEKVPKGFFGCPHRRTLFGSR